MNTSETRHKYRKQILAGAILFAILLTCIAVFFVYKHSKISSEYQEQLTAASKYMQELNYKKAEDAFLKAIKIKPNKEKAYLQLSRLYEKQGAYKKAAALLQKGAGKSPSQIFKTAQTELKNTARAGEYKDSFVKQELIPQLGKSDKYYIYDNWDSDDCYGWADTPGIISTYLCNLNDDISKELAVLYSKRADSNSFSHLCKDETVNGLFLAVYSLEENRFVFRDEILLTAPFDGGASDIKVTAADADGHQVLIYEKRDSSIAQEVREFAVFECTDEGKFQSKMNIIDYGFQGRAWLYALTGDQLKDMVLRTDNSIDLSLLTCLYKEEPEASAEGSYDSYGEAIRSEFQKIGISVLTEGTYENFRLRFTDPNIFNLAHIRAKINFQTDSDFYILTAEILDNTNYISEKQENNKDESSGNRSYYDLCKEYENKFGAAGAQQWEGSDIYDLTGLCVVKLLDFNGDGKEELLLGYKQNSAEMTRYAYEVWGIADGQLKQILAPTGPAHSNGDAVWIQTTEKDGILYLYGTPLEQEDKMVEEYLYYEEEQFTPKYRIESEYDSSEVIINGQEATTEEWNQLADSFGWFFYPDNRYINEENRKIKIPVAYLESTDKEQILQETKNTMEELERKQK